MVNRDPAEPDIISRALAKNRLGVPSVVFFGVAGAAPLTVIIGALLLPETRGRRIDT